MKEFFEKVRGSFRNIIDFLKDTRKELNNVSWPARREVTGTTLVVIVAVFFFGFFLFVADFIVENGMTSPFPCACRRNPETEVWIIRRSGTSFIPTPDMSARSRRAL